MLWGHPCPTTMGSQASQGCSHWPPFAFFGIAPKQKCLFTQKCRFFQEGHSQARTLEMSLVAPRMHSDWGQ